MIFGIGIDILDINKIKDAIKRNGKDYLDYVYTPDEQSSIASDECLDYAVKFAFKEAVWKSLNTGWTDGKTFTDIQVKLTNDVEFELFGKTMILSKEVGINKFSGKYKIRNNHVIAYVISMK